MIGRDAELLQGSLEALTVFLHKPLHLGGGRVQRQGGLGIALGEFGIVVTTTDGGATWKKGTSIPGDFYPYATLFLNPNEGWTSGLAGQILHTRDGGKTWTKDPWSKDSQNAGAALYQLFLHEGKPYGTGANGIVARYDGGTWKPMAYPDAVPVFLGAGTPVGPHLIALGGPGGLVRVVDTLKN